MLTGAWSAAQPVTFSTAPATPTVTVTGYPANTWTAPQSGSTTVTFADSSASAASYTYQLDGGTPVTVTGAGVQLTPAPGWHTLAVSASRAGGAASSTASYGFGVGAGVLTGPVDGSSGDGTAVALTASSAPGLTSVRYQYRTVTSGAFADLPVGTVTSAGSPISAWPLATNPDGSSPALVWNASLSVQTNGLLQVQAVFTDANGLTSTSAPAGYTMTRPSPPGLPTQLNATALNGGAQVTWAPPATGAAYVTGYTVTASNGGFTFGSPVTVAANAPLTATFGNMSNGASYTVTVVANSPYGTSAPVSVTVTPSAS
ncbi:MULTISPECIES: fibronectin type III domain-containing protein [unclassified Kitasatospora]|uniref:fibronectin type III domain-containing protein n=1 Tax=unclassified Kitasatospora TaxID=2633591 RepID=UPI002473DB10|nr:fibronectin type III domain-containing protein [Kitasatospora sp. MAP12-44]